MSLRLEPPPHPVARFDEARFPSGGPREVWGRLRDSLERLGAEELEKRWREGRRLLDDNRVTYNVYGDPRGIDRPWELDPMPQLVPSEEWKVIESAVVQRATLLSAILHDVYGPQKLVEDGVLPADLLFRHPGFLRPCHGIGRPEVNPLVVYSADLARSPDGQWRIIADRTQAPSGAGYALENRLVVSRILQEPFGAFNVRRLAGYFRTLRDSLMALAPRSEGDPRVVLLTPGPFNETYFEHAYLARYLGFPLVEGGDLTVRNERVYLKTLRDLQSVDVVLRRQDDHFCDPLELYGASALGVAGLTQAVRAGNVAVANGLGSGFAETPVLMTFLAELSRRILGEDLVIPSVESWWCGTDEGVAQITERTGELVVKPAFPGPDSQVVFGSRLDREAARGLRNRVLDRPWDFVAQEEIALSTVPVGFGPTAESRPLVLRVFAVATAHGYEVMPGGLTRFSASEHGLVVSSQAGGGSKDTWVLSDRWEPHVSLLGTADGRVDVKREGPALTSRVADNLFWLGRMVERFDTGVRLFRASLGTPARGAQRGDGAPPSMIDFLWHLGYLNAGWREIEQDPRALLSAAILDESPPRSLARDASRMRRLAWLVRDRISDDAWRALTQLEPRLAEAARDIVLPRESAGAALDAVLFTLSAFKALVADGASRGIGWRFLDMGRCLERGLCVGEVVREGWSMMSANARFPEILLEVTDCATSYRARYLTSVRWDLAIDLLVLDASNPRSLAFQLTRIDEHLTHLEDAPSDGLDSMLERLRVARSADLVDGSVVGGGDLESMVSEMAGGLLELSVALDHAYLSHALPGRQPVAGGTAE